MAQYGHLKVNCQLKYKISYLVESALHLTKLKSDFQNSVWVTSNLMLKLGFHLLLYYLYIKTHQIPQLSLYLNRVESEPLYETSSQKFVYDFVEYHHINPRPDGVCRATRSDGGGDNLPPPPWDLKNGAT